MDPSKRSTSRVRFPRIYAGRRRRWLHRLVLNGLAQGAAAFALAHLLQRALGSARSGDVEALAVVGMVVTGLVIWGLRIAEANDAERVGQDYVMRVRIRLFERLMEGPDDHARRRRYGVPMSRMISDLNALRNWVSVGVARSLVASIMVVGLLVTMATIDPSIALVLGGLVAVAVLVMLGAAPTLRRRVRDARRRRGRLANNLGEKVLARETVRQFARVKRERRRIRRQSDRLAESLVQRARMAQVLRATPAALLPIALAALVFVTASSGASLESVVAAVLVVGLLTTSLAELARAFDYRLSFEEGRERIGDLLARTRRGSVAEAGDTGAWPIEIEDVAVAGRLSRVSFEAKAGEFVHVVGDAAAGKSTLIRLLAGRLAPDHGTIRLGPVAWTGADAVDPSEVVQCVSPDAPLLRGTVGSNLDYASGGASGGASGRDERDLALFRAVRAACDLGDGAPGLPEGLDTRVEERGTNLAASLRARIALARAALARPRVLLVDDPAFVIDAAARRALLLVREIVSATLVIVAPEDALDAPADRVWRLGPGAAEPGGDATSSSSCRQDAAGGRPALRPVV